MTPIEHVVVICKENHTFDNYFGSFSGANGEVLAQAANPPASDPTHTHPTWMKRGSDTRYHVQYKEADIAGYFDLARQFTLCDNYFSEVAGPSSPNHLFLIAADSPIIANPYNMYRPSANELFTIKSVPAMLTKAGLTWGNYGGYIFGYVKGLSTKGNSHSRDTFVKNARAGKLPNVSWVYGDGTPNLSEHPVQIVTDGMRWTLQAIEAIAAGGLWPKTMVFVTWDDWGGWYDHVTPPNVEAWNPNYAQHSIDAHKLWAGQQFRYGSRVPCLVVGPYAKPNHISSQLNSHVSIPRFIEDNFGLGHINARDGVANGMTDCYDYSQNALPPYTGTY
jgi:phospholipase C